MPTPNHTSHQLQRLQAYYQRLKDHFHQTHAGASHWFRDRALTVEDFRITSGQILAAASLAGGVALHSPVMANLTKTVQQIHSSADPDLAQISQEERQVVLSKLVQYLQRPPGHLPTDEELYLTGQLSDFLGFNVTAQLDGHRLNHSLGIMGAEQHLRRFPTDDLDQHQQYWEAGLAPNRGAFGWFTENGVLTQSAIEREKYYLVVQTLYLPDWNTNYRALKPWYKFRKMVVINPVEQLAVVGVVGDAGPAAGIGKQFGGSPEVIREGKIWSRASRGRVLVLFVDDPQDQVPLGVVDLTSTNISLPSPVPQPSLGANQLLINQVNLPVPI